MTATFPWVVVVVLLLDLVVFWDCWTIVAVLPVAPRRNVTVVVVSVPLPLSSDSTRIVSL